MISLDELVNYALYGEQIDNKKDNVEYYIQSRAILKSELLTCYQFLQEKGILKDYKEFRG